MKYNQPKLGKQLRKEIIDAHIRGSSPSSICIWSNKPMSQVTAVIKKHEASLTATLPMKVSEK